VPSIDPPFTSWNVRSSDTNLGLPPFPPITLDLRRKTERWALSSDTNQRHGELITVREQPCHVCPTISTDSMVLGLIVFPFLKRGVRMAAVDDVRSSKHAPRRVGAHASHHRVLGIRPWYALISLLSYCHCPNLDLRPRCKRITWLGYAVHLGRGVARGAGVRPVQ
jgi:hypothetical protein